MKHLDIKIDKGRIPKEIMNVVLGLEKAGFQAWLVGGCIRDLILGLEPKDWDITTDALPEQIQAIFPRNYYENSFGTVGVVSYETTIPEEIAKIPKLFS